MATINTPLFASQTGAVAGWKSSVLSQGKVRLASVVIPSGTVLAVGDKINLVRLPANARVLPALSVSNNGNATARVSIGDAAVVDRYAAAVGNAARAYLSSFGNKPDATLASATRTSLRRSQPARRSPLTGRSTSPSASSNHHPGPQPSPHHDGGGYLQSGARARVRKRHCVVIGCHEVRPPVPTPLCRHRARGVAGRAMALRPASRGARSPRPAARFRVVLRLSASR